jgi:alpha-aminoadipate carrier protein LysW
MPLETSSGTAECPECFGDVNVEEVMESEIVQCPECGAELEVVSLDPLQLAKAPEAEEDWGE